MQFNDLFDARIDVSRFFGDHRLNQDVVSATDRHVSDLA